MLMRVDAFMIRATRGSSCGVPDELRGPWRTLQAAREAKALYEHTKLLGGPDATNGRYPIIKVQGERLADGRIILDGLLVVKGFINETDQEGWTVPDEPVLIGDSECLLVDGAVIEDEQKTLP
jgi:hypothetical protein